MTQQSISRWEAGTYRPRPAQLAALATLLRLKTTDLVVLAGYEQPAVESLAAPLPVDRLDPFMFEQFAAALVHCLHPGAEVRRVGGQGHSQGGADISADLPDGRRLDLQCKRVSRFGPGEVRKVIQAYSRHADRKVIVLSRIASPQAAEEVRKHAGWSLWDKDDITRIFRHDISKANQETLVDIYFRHQRRAILGRDEPGAWLTVDAFFRPFSSRSKVLSHEWRLVGRENELAALLSTAAGAAVGMLVGAGGIGKSRLLKEFASRLARAEPATTLRFLDRDSDLTRADLEALGPGPKFIVVDDAHDRDRLRLLFAFVSDGENQARVLVAARPYAAERIRQEAATSSITDIPTVVLGAMRRSSLVALAEEILANYDCDRSWAAEIVGHASDSPLATALFARSAARDGKPPELARGTADVRDLTSGKFADVLLGDLGRGRNGAVIRNILEIVALVQPFHPEDPGLLGLLNEVKDIRSDPAERALRDLIDGGVVFRRRGRHRLMPDLLGDCLVERSCVDAAGGLSRFAEAALRAMPPALLPNALVNLGRLDWRRSEGDPAESRLLEGVWRGFASIKEEGDPRLEAAKSVAVYQPSQALGLVAELIRRGRRLPSLADILRGVAHHHDHLPHACDLLWRLGRDDPRELGPHPSHPLRILIEAGGYAPEKHRGHSEQVLAFALGLMDNPANWRGAHTPLTLLEPLMRLEGETSRSTVRAITLTPFYVNYEAVRPIREAIIGRVLQLLVHDDVVIARRAACFIGTLLHGPMGIFNIEPLPSLVQACQAEFGRTLRRIAGLVPRNLAPPVLLVIARTVAGLGRRGSGPIAKLARSILRRLPDSLEFRLLAALGCGSGVYLQDHDPMRWHVEEQVWLARVANEVRRAHPDAAQCRLALEEGIQTLLEAGENASSHQLVALILRGNRELQRATIEDALTRPDSPTRRYVGCAIAMLMSDAPEEGRALAHRLLGTDRECLARAVAGAYYGLSTPPSAEDIAIVHRLMSAAPSVVPEAARAVASWREASPRERIDLLVHARVDGNALVVDELAMVLGGLNRSLLDHLRSDDATRILAWLEPMPTLDGHWTDELLAEFSHRFPSETAEFLMRRVERASASESYGFRAANFGPYGHRRLRFLESGAGQAILGRVWGWRLDNQERGHVFQYAAARMFQAMFLHEAGRVVDLFGERLAIADNGELKLMGAVLRNAHSDFVFARAPFVERLLERCAELDPDSNSTDRAMGDLFASAISGVHSGVPGEPMPRDLLMREQAESVIRTLSKASAAYPLYEAIRSTARGNIDRARVEAEELDAA